MESTRFMYQSKCENLLIRQLSGTCSSGGPCSTSCCRVPDAEAALGRTTSRAPAVVKHPSRGVREWSRGRMLGR